MKRPLSTEELIKMERLTTKDWKTLVPDIFYNRLAELEDKLENGQLVELPCLVNTLSPKYKVIVYRGKDGALYKTHQFETREAETRLKELRDKLKPNVEG